MRALTAINLERDAYLLPPKLKPIGTLGTGPSVSVTAQSWLHG